VSREGNKWRVDITFQGQNTYFGGFDTEEAAAKAYDEEAKRQWTNPTLNFLPDGSLNPDRKKRISWRSLIARSRQRGHSSLQVMDSSEEEEDEEDEDSDHSSGDEAEDESDDGGKQRASIFRGVC
jgi:hypothetical protein